MCHKSIVIIIIILIVIITDVEIITNFAGISTPPRRYVDRLISLSRHGELFGPRGIVLVRIHVELRVRDSGDSNHQNDPHDEVRHAEQEEAAPENFERIDDGSQRCGDIRGFRLNKIARDELPDGIFDGEHVPEIVEERRKLFVGVGGDFISAADTSGENLRSGKCALRVLSTTRSRVDFTGIHAFWNVSVPGVLLRVQVMISANRIRVVEIGLIVLIQIPLAITRNR